MNTIINKMFDSEEQASYMSIALLVVLSLYLYFTALSFLFSAVLGFIADQFGFQTTLSALITQYYDHGVIAKISIFYYWLKPALISFVMLFPFYYLCYRINRKPNFDVNHNRFKACIDFFAISSTFMVIYVVLACQNIVFDLSSDGKNQFYALSAVLFVIALVWGSIKVKNVRYVALGALLFNAVFLISSAFLNVAINNVKIDSAGVTKAHLSALVSDASLTEEEYIQKVSAMKPESLSKNAEISFRQSDETHFTTLSYSDDTCLLPGVDTFYNPSILSLHLTRGEWQDCLHIRYLAPGEEDVYKKYLAYFFMVPSFSSIYMPTYGLPKIVNPHWTSEEKLEFFTMLYQVLEKRATTIDKNDKLVEAFFDVILTNNKTRYEQISKLLNSHASASELDKMYADIVSLKEDEGYSNDMMPELITVSEEDYSKKAADLDYDESDMTFDKVRQVFERFKSSWL